MALREDGGLDLMITRKFLGINEVIRLAKYTSIKNPHLERPKLKNTTYASPNVQNEIINLGKNIILKYLVDKKEIQVNFYNSG